MKGFGILLAISLFAFAAADEEAVATLTDSNFDDFISDHPLTLVEFYAPWCGHCKKLAPEYEKAAQALKAEGSEVVLGKVDATVETEVSGRYEVNGYPTLKFFRKGSPEEYEGGRDEAGILEWIAAFTGPAVKSIPESELEELLKLKTVVFTFKGDNSTDLYKGFDEIANSNRDAGTFLHLEGSGSEIKVNRQEEEAVVFKGEASDLLGFVQLEKHFLFGRISGDTYMKYAQRELPLVWACMDTDTSEKYRTVFSDVAKKYRETYSLVWLDSEQFSGHAEGSLGVTDYPALVVTLESGRYIFNSEDFKPAGDALFTVESVVEFLEAASAGKLEKNLKSEPIPEADDDAVKTIVGKNFEDVIFNSGKDVLLEVYAPWCGHCKKLEPIYKEFAESVSGNDHLIVAKMDGTANESPVENFDWEGFPTIFFIKAGMKPGEKPETFEGDRNFEALTEYVRENSSKPAFTPQSAKREDL